MRRQLFAALLAASLAACASSPPPEITQSPAPAAAPAANSAAQVFEVSLGANAQQAASGRLIIFARPWTQAAPNGQSPTTVRGGGADPVASIEIEHLAPGEPVIVNADALAWPAPFSRMPPGEYAVQAVLDADHSMAYSSALTPGDRFSPVYAMKLPGGLERLELGAPVTRTSAVQPAPGTQDAAAERAFERQLYNINFESPSLSEFWGRPIRIRGFVLTPPNYEATGERYPTVYRTEGFGANLSSIRNAARRQWSLMASGETPPMIRVFLDHSSPWGTHEFADSANTGPWGKALTEELIPWLETQYKMDGEASGRFVTGHSSGGWFAIWQQVRYPEVFGGSWARAPDPVDFRSFTGVDIYRPGANAYVRPDGSEQYLVRDPQGVRTTSLKTYARRGKVMGDYGGQFDSFDWVFSPRGDDGRAMPLFDNVTGAVDAEVAKHWRENYDISHIIRRDWVSLKSVLDGKIHVIMGTMDTFHLDEAARLLEAEMKKLGAKADFFWMEGRTHGNLDRIGDDPNGLEKKIAWEMYAVARPKSGLKPKPYVSTAPAAP